MKHTVLHTNVCIATQCQYCVNELHILWAHVVFALLFIKFAFLLCGCISVLLILGYQVVHVAFGLGEFHLIHSFTSVPMQEGPAAEHSRKILCYTLEHFLNCCGITQEGDC